MRNIKLTLAYDGSAFHGWQIQPGVPTIQGAITDAVRKITQEQMSIHGASRTDAGVHALRQVASFKTQSTLATEEFQRALNALLPPGIRVVAAEEMGADFHARWQALEKAEMVYEVTGKSFLRYMVRKIVGTLLEVGRGKLRAEDIAGIFESRDRSKSGPTAPPEGLYLVALKYPEPWKIG